MRFFSPIYMRKCELWPIRLAITKKASPITASVAYHGQVTFVPVRADGVRLRHFDTTFLGSSAPLNDLSAIEGSIFPFAFDENGEYNAAASKDLCRYATEYDGYTMGGIYIPKWLKSGDILLCSRSHPFRMPFLEADLK